MVLFPPRTRPILLHIRQDVDLGDVGEDGGGLLVVPGERLDAVLVEAAQEAAQAHLLQEALVLLQRRHVVT